MAPVHWSADSKSGRAAKYCGCVFKNIIAGTVGDSIGRLWLGRRPPPLPLILLLEPLLLMERLSNRPLVTVFGRHSSYALSFCLYMRHRIPNPETNPRETLAVEQRHVFTPILPYNKPLIFNPHLS